MLDVTEVVALLSQKASLLLLEEMDANPNMVANVLARLQDSIQEWEDRGVALDPIQFEVVTDAMVKHFAASFLASQTLIEKFKKCECLKELGDEADADVSSG